MEGDQKFRFVCKLCNKRCPSGKSLGGHMRSHAIAISAESKEKVEPTMKNVSSLNGESGFELGEQSGYGLRENPKKTWRAADSSFPLQEEKVCKQCGKGFQSMKALCGHMACHSEKERVLNDDCSWSSENHKLVMDGQSDTEAKAAPRRRKRPPASMRYKRSVVKCSSVSLANGSSVSEIEQEQEELAMCLMMLSRDSGKRGGVNLVTESSDNNSVVLETKSSSIDMRIGKKEGFGTVETKKLREMKLKSGVSDDELVQFENSDFGCFRNEVNKVESDLSVGGFLRNDEYRKPKVDDGTRFNGSDVEFGKKGLNRLKCKEAELIEERKGLINEKGYDEAGIASNSVKDDSRKRFSNGSYNSELCGEYSKKKRNGFSSADVFKNAQKRSKFESCRNKNPISQDLSCNAERNSKQKKSKGHVCPICLRVFKSGQALGGHKRIHLIGGSEDKSNQTPVIKQVLHKISDLIDLNLPAPMEDEEDELAQFMPQQF